jgi:nitroreductase/predicted transcriptional regulator YdeE
MLEPRFIERGSFTIVGVAIAGELGKLNYGEIWEKQYMPIDTLLKPYSIDGGCYGTTLSEGDHLIYLAGVAVADMPEMPEGTVKREIPAGNFAVFDCLMSTMSETVQEVYGQWFYSSGHELDTEAVSFEYYPPYSGVGEMRVEIYITVKPKSTALIQPGDMPMNVIEAITNRRSIRKFKNDPVPEAAIRQIIQAGLLAPSGSNRQPWKFYVVQEDKCAEMTARLREGIEHRKREGINTGSAMNSLRVMEKAPVTVFVFNPAGTSPWTAARTIDQEFTHVVDIQSVGAAIQNMLLTAEGFGLGTLWVCDVFSAYEELSTWLGESSEMVAAVCIGVPDEHPIARKRKSFDTVVHWV